MDRPPADRALNHGWREARPRATARVLRAALAGWALAGSGAASLAQEPPGVTPATPPEVAPEVAPGATTAVTSGPAAPLPEGAEPLPTPTLESAREVVRATTVWLARGVDSWFGDRPFEAGGRVSDGVLGIGLFKRESESADVNVRLHARVRLPNLHEGGFAFLGRDNPRELIADTPGSVARQERLRPETRDDREFLAGIGVALLEAFDLRLGVRGGLKPYAQARYHEQWQPGEPYLVEFKQTFFLSREDQLGSTTALSAAYAAAPQWALRSLGVGTTTQRTRRYEFSTVFGAYRDFEGGRLLSLELSTYSLEGTGVRLDDGGVLVKWAQPWLREWLVGEVALGSFWPRPDRTLPREHRWAVGAGVRLSF